MTNFTHPSVWLRERIGVILDEFKLPADKDTLNQLEKRLLRVADEATNNVRMEREIIANDMKLGAYRVRDPKTGEFGKLQFHFTQGNYVVAVASESAAKLFANFVFDTLGDKRCISDVAAEVKEKNRFENQKQADAELMAKAAAHFRTNNARRSTGNQMVEGPLEPILTKPGHGDASAFENPAVKEAFDKSLKFEDPRDMPFRGHDAERWGRTGDLYVAEDPRNPPTIPTPQGWRHHTGRVYLHETFGRRAKLVLQPSGAQLWDDSNYFGTFESLQKAADYAQNTIIKMLVAQALIGDEGGGC